MNHLRPRILAAIALIAFISLLIVYRSMVKTQTQHLFHWVQDMGVNGFFIFILLYSLIVIFILPSSVFTFGAGVLFGVGWGSVAVVAGTTLGSAIGFILGRHALSDRFRHYILHHPRLALVNLELRHHSFKVVLLTRLTPMFPGKLSNYFFGIAGFDFLRFIYGTALGVIPFSILDVWIGRMVGIWAVPGQQMVTHSPIGWFAIVMGFIGSILLIISLVRTIRKALHQKLNQS